MKIKNFPNKTPIIKGSGKTKSTSATNKTQTAKSSNQSQSAQKSGVNITATDKIASSFSSDASQRAEKVAQIKLDVESGNYNIDSGKTASKLIDSLTDYSLA